MRNPNKGTLNNPSKMPVFLTILLIFGLPVVASAQMPEGSIVLPSDVTISGSGWGQLRDLEELSSFFLAVLETMAFVAAFAFHPRASAVRQGQRGWLVQASLFLFGLIGMLIGFLVIHHGYLIGFVVFGIGGLFRFRMESSSLLDGALLILVTLIGLSVGLDLPVMALVATIAGWTTLWFVIATKTTALELKFKDEESLTAALDLLRKTLEGLDFRVVSVKKTDFKPVVELILSHKDADAVNGIPGILEDLRKEGLGVKGWYVS